MEWWPVRQLVHAYQPYKTRKSRWVYLTHSTTRLPGPQEGPSRDKASVSIQCNPPTVDKTLDLNDHVHCDLSSTGSHTRSGKGSNLGCGITGFLWVCLSRGAASERWLCIYPIDVPNLGRHSTCQSGHAIYAMDSRKGVKVLPVLVRCWPIHQEVRKQMIPSRV